MDGCDVAVGKRKFWGWGLEGEGLGRVELEQLGATFADRFGIEGVRIQEPPRAEELELRPPRLSPPSSLQAAFSVDPYDRAGHTYGRSFRDLVRAFRRDYGHAPDLVAFPRDEDEGRCAITHSRLSGRRWAAGSRPVPGAISRPSIPTSTSS